MYTIREVRKLKEPLFNWNWIAQLPTISGIDPPVAETVDLPFPHIESNPFYGSGSNTYFPGIEDISAFGITFYVDNDLNAIRYITAWNKLIRNPNGTYNYPSNYKRNIICHLYTRERQLITTYLMKGVFPTTKQPIPFSYEASERVRLSVEFSIDEGTMDTGSGGTLTTITDGSQFGQIA